MNTAAAAASTTAAAVVAAVSGTAGQNVPVLNGDGSTSEFLRFHFSAPEEVVDAGAESSLVG